MLVKMLKAVEARLRQRAEVHPKYPFAVPMNTYSAYPSRAFRTQISCMSTSASSSTLSSAHRRPIWRPPRAAHASCLPQCSSAAHTASLHKLHQHDYTSPHGKARTEVEQEGLRGAERRRGLAQGLFEDVDALRHSEVGDLSEDERGDGRTSFSLPWLSSATARSFVAF